VRFALLLLYAGYLVHVGLLMIILPWSDSWLLILTRLPDAAATLLDSPAVRGAISAFGVLHLLLIVAEVVLPETVKRLL